MSESIVKDADAKLKECSVDFRVRPNGIFAAR